jgi:hypothetical protein
MPSSPTRRAWLTMPVRSRIDRLEPEKVRRWLEDLPPALGYAVSARPLRYRRAPHLGAFCWYDDHLIELQVPEPFRAWSERVYHRAHRKPGPKLAFRWESKTIRFRTRREVLRFLYCHEFYHWYLREVRGRKAAAETACDRFALEHFRRRHSDTDWSSLLPGYRLTRPRPLSRSA